MSHSLRPHGLQRQASLPFTISWSLLRLMSVESVMLSKHLILCCFEEGSGPRVLLKSGPGNRGRSACSPTHVARLEFCMIGSGSLGGARDFFSSSSSLHFSLGCLRTSVHLCPHVGKFWGRGHSFPRTKSARWDSVGKCQEIHQNLLLWGSHGFSKFIKARGP